jgi:hypothetical protein
MFGVQRSAFGVRRSVFGLFDSHVVCAAHQSASRVKQTTHRLGLGQLVVMLYCHGGFLDMIGNP